MEIPQPLRAACFCASPSSPFLIRCWQKKTRIFLFTPLFSHLLTLHYTLLGASVFTTTCYFLVAEDTNKSSTPRLPPTHTYTHRLSILRWNKSMFLLLTYSLRNCFQRWPFNTRQKTFILYPFFFIIYYYNKCLKP